MKNQIENLSNELRSLINEPKNTVILTHVNPDGDAMGSSLALYHFLIKKGHNVTVIIPNEFPDFLKWLKGSELVVEYKTNQKKAAEILDKAQLLICADFNEIDRLKGVKDHLGKNKATRLLIDHHVNPPDLYDHVYMTTVASSTAELVYRFIQDLGELSLIDKDIAECIFTGIMTDTGCFSHNDSRPITYQVVSSLMSIGVNKDKIFNYVYNNFSANRMRLLGYAISEKMIVLPELHTAYMVLTEEELGRFHFEHGDTEGFVNIPFSIKGIHFTAFFLEKKDMIKISLRSHGDFSVNDLARKHFNGGGHKNAAGGETKPPLAEAIKLFENILKEYETELKALS